MNAIKRAAAELRDFRMHLDSWCADDFFERGVPPAPSRRASLAAKLAWLRLTLPLVCALRGHVLVDDDIGDPEVGPQPNVYCERCGR